jgi:rhodanese-related sulfurtransferase
MSRLNFVTLEELMEMKENDDNFTLLDTLSEDMFSDWHIPGAKHIPASEIEDRAEDELDKSDTIVTYCANYKCHASTKAARKLIELGFSDVRDFKGGKKIWQEAGLEQE